MENKFSLILTTLSTSSNNGLFVVRKGLYDVLTFAGYYEMKFVWVISLFILETVVVSSDLEVRAVFYFGQ